MLEMFILNPPSGTRTRDAPKRRRRKARRLPKRDPLGKFIGKQKKRRTGMARRVKRRGHRRGGWFRQKPDHSVAGKIGRAGRMRSPWRRRRYIRSTVGIKRLKSYRKAHNVARRRKHAPTMFRASAFGKTYSLAANRRRRRRYASNPRRSRRLPARGRGGRFVSRRRRYADNRKRRRAGRSRTRRAKSYDDNWFVYDNNPRRRRRRGRSRRRYQDNRRRVRRYRRNVGHRYMKNPIEDILSTVKGVFDVEFLTGTALPVVGGFFGSRAISGLLGPAILGTNYTGIAAHLGNLVSAGLAGAAVGLIFKDPDMAGNVILGGVVNAIAGIAKDVVKDMKFVQDSPELSQVFGLPAPGGLSGMGQTDIARQVEAEVMRELGVSDFLTAEQLSRAERVGDVSDFLTAEQLSRAERISQYPSETSGGMAQYPSETSGGAMADFADVASFGG